MGGWISVDDRMPENNAICLVCGKKGGMRVARAYVTRAYIGKSYTWWTVVGTGKYFNATHWMPLPEPPKEPKKRIKDHVCNNDYCELE